MTDSMICWILLGVLACVSCQEPEPEPGYITIFEGYFANNGSKNDIGTGHFKWNFRSKTTAEDEKNTTISREADKLKVSRDLSKYSFKLDILLDNITTNITFLNITTGQIIRQFSVPNNKPYLLRLSQNDTLLIFNITSSWTYTFNSDSEVTIDAKDKFTVEKKKGKDDRAIKVTFLVDQLLNLPDLTIYYDGHSSSNIKYEESGKIIEGNYECGIKAWFPHDAFLDIFRDNLKRLFQ